MAYKFIAFDIETAKVLPSGFDDLHNHRPLGISCAATWCTDESEAEVFYSEKSNGSLLPQMTVQDLNTFIDHLNSKVEAGYTILTHNGLGFDFDILAEEAERFEICRSLALHHVDTMFHFFCGKGFPVSLNSAANAIGNSKPSDVDGSVAPKLWKEGDFQKVINYIAQDCRLTLDVAETSESRGQINWITQRGRESYFLLPNGWLTVEQASQLPLPDTSWMDKPWPRSKFTAWLNKR